MLIREMAYEDLQQVEQIEKESFSMPWSQQGFKDALELEDTQLMVIEQDGKIIGYTCMYISFNEGEITNVAVSKELRGLGLGKELMKATLDNAVNRNVDRVVLEVRVSNQSAIGLYKSMGYEELGIRKNFYEHPKEDALIMAWEKNK